MRPVGDRDVAEVQALLDNDRSREAGPNLAPAQAGTLLGADFRQKLVHRFSPGRLLGGAPALRGHLLFELRPGVAFRLGFAPPRPLGLGQLNPSAVYKRLRAAEEWLRWLAEQMRAGLGLTTPQLPQRLRAVDAATISEPGSTGTDWRIYYAMNVASLQCDFFLLTGVRAGETWRRFPVLPGDIMLGDRGYANPPGVAHVVAAGGGVVVRWNRTALPLFDQEENRLPALQLASRLQPQQNGEREAWGHTGTGQPIPGRLIIVRRSELATAHARKKLYQQAGKRQKRVSAEALEAAQYFFLWTTLPSAWSRTRVLELYRSRWQIELAFKRMKSIMGLGHLPKKNPESCRAWLHGKLFTSLLIERMIGAAKRSSPLGIRIGRRAGARGVKPSTEVERYRQAPGGIQATPQAVLCEVNAYGGAPPGRVGCIRPLRDLHQVRGKAHLPGFPKREVGQVRPGDRPLRDLDRAVGVLA